MGRFIEGDARSQSVLFPEHLEDWVDEENPVRVVDAFVEGLDLRTLGFDGADPARTGRPAYHPATLLKIYIYGYLNRIQSSRRLEREAQRNVELIWLTGRLMPDFKTIADFRRDNGSAIRKVCKQFVELCRRMGLFGDAAVAIDGSKFKAVNNRDKNFTDRKLAARQQQLEESIERYLVELDRADREPGSVLPGRVSRLKEKIASMRDQMGKLAQIGEQMKASEDGQISLTDPDSRSMATSGRGTGIVGYNVQTAVDLASHMIVAHEVTNVGNDRTQLASMAVQARDAMGQEKLTAFADRGYYKGDELLKCEQAGIDAIVPRTTTSNNNAKGQFDKRDFTYIPESDEYRCPANQRAIRRCTSIEHGMTQHRYWSSACPQCPIKAQCTDGVNRRISRWEHEEVLDRAQARLEQRPDAAKLRRRTAEHPFGTLKFWFGATHFLTKTLPRVQTEMSLNILAYNMKRAIRIFGIATLIEAARG